jgi:uncharacterized membrane protein (UPF0127 family)
MGVANVAEGYSVKAEWIVAAIVVALSLAGAAYYLSTHANGSVESSKVDLIGSGGTATVSVEIADTPFEQEKGLMNRTSLNESEGMLFIFGGDTRRSFWMQNTPLPLDMIFVDSGLTIVDINHNATPYSESIFTSAKPCKYVVEVNGGFCEAHGIAIGDKIKIY